MCGLAAARIYRHEMLRPRAPASADSAIQNDILYPGRLGISEKEDSGFSLICRMVIVIAGLAEIS
jgi:hypothetical protein